MKLKIPKEEFYKLNPKKFRRYLPYYREILKQEEERRREELDLSAWVNGVYVSRAIAQLGKHHYPERPLNLFGVESLEEAPEDGMTPEKRAAEGFSGFAYVFNKERKKKKEREERERGLISNG